MNNNHIIYRSQFERDRDEFWYQFLGDHGTEILYGLLGLIALWVILYAWSAWLTRRSRKSR